MEEPELHVGHLHAADASLHDGGEGEVALDNSTRGRQSVVITQHIERVSTARPVGSNVHWLLWGGGVAKQIVPLVVGIVVNRDLGWLNNDGLRKVRPVDEALYRQGPQPGRGSVGISASEDGASTAE